MIIPARTRLIAHQAWSGLRIPSESDRIPNWTDTGVGVASLIAGLRGTGQALRGADCVYNFQIFVNTYDLIFDTRLTAAIGSDELVVTGRNAGFDVFQLRRNSTGQLYINASILGAVDSAPSTQIFSSNVVHKIELLVYCGMTVSGVETSYFAIVVDGLVWLKVHNFKISATSFSHFKWVNANQDLGEVSIFAGVGGWTIGDMRSDVMGNPRILPIGVTANGFYNDGSPTGAATNWQSVNETLSDTTTYCSIPSTDQTDRQSFLLQSLPGTVTRVLGISGMYYSRNTTGGQQFQPLFWRSNPQAGIGIDDYHRDPWITGYSAPTSFNSYVNGFWRKDPATGQEFTPAAVNTGELGFGPQGGGTTQVSNVYAEVLCYVSPPAVLAAGTGIQHILKNKAHRFARIFELIPKWGHPMFFTEHNRPLQIGFNTYQPTKGIEGSDVRRELGLVEGDMDVQGVLSSDLIRPEDVRAGKFTGAILLESLVDWRVPWMGTLRKAVWILGDHEQDGERFLMTASGIQERLSQSAGDNFYSACRHQLFDNDYAVAGTTPSWDRGCKLDSTRFWANGTVGTVTDNRIFQITGLNVTTSNWNNGLVVFVDGNNQNICGTVRSVSGSTFTLHAPMPLPVTLLNTVLLFPGCNFLVGGPNAGDCIDVYNNGKRHGGFLLTPGTARASRGSEF